MVGTEDSALDSSGTVYQRGPDNRYWPKQSFFGYEWDLDPITLKPNLARDLFGNAEPKRDSLGFREKGSQGRPLYEPRVEGASFDWGSLIGEALWATTRLSIVVGMQAVKWFRHSQEKAQERAAFKAACDAASSCFTGQLGTLIRDTSLLPRDLEEVFRRGQDKTGPARQLALVSHSGIEDDLSLACAHPHPCVRYAARQALERAGHHPAVNRGLALSLSDPVDSLRQSAHQALRDRRERGWLKAIELTPALPGASREVCSAIISMVSQENALDMVPLLAIMMENDPRPQVRSYAADIIRWSRSPEAVEPLIRRVRMDPDAGVRHSAMASLGDLRDWRAMEPAIEALRNDQDAKVRCAAIEALKDLELMAFSHYRKSWGRSTSDYRNEYTKDMTPPEEGYVARTLLSSLDDGAPEVRKQVLSSLVSSIIRPPNFTDWGLTSGEKAALTSQVRKMAVQDPSEEVRIEAEASLPDGRRKEITCCYCYYIFSPYQHTHCPFCGKSQPADRCRIILRDGGTGNRQWVAVRAMPWGDGQTIKEGSRESEKVPWSSAELERQQKVLILKLIFEGWKTEPPDPEPINHWAARDAEHHVMVYRK